MDHQWWFNPSVCLSTCFSILSIETGLRVVPTGLELTIQLRMVGPQAHTYLVLCGTEDKNLGLCVCRVSTPLTNLGISLTKTIQNWVKASFHRTGENTNKHTAEPTTYCLETNLSNKGDLLSILHFSPLTNAEIQVNKGY